ncbi:O-antigen translocase [Flavobacterium selenitireducens]|uniref:O-antigen translocase n=1 Tax=Flavobacterium selenitireducens TaxID=2722704 RepID=UPI00168BFF23|nr:O-antigen translocase [Flavobacterium selenitireducens]MBD3582671.1 O-antigen translocase [Flavobacterium selenitireducens]
MGVPKKILQSSLLRATSLNAFGVLVKIVIGFATSKVIAVFVGPSGMALVGNLRNFLTSLEGVATLGFQNGIVKYVAESKTSDTELRKAISTIFISLFAIMAICCAALFVFSVFWSNWIFDGNSGFSSIFRILAIALPFYALSIVLIAILNGLGNYRNVIWANIFGNLIGLAISIGLIVQLKLFGALLAIVLSPSALFFVTIVYMRREIPLWTFISIGNFDRSLLKRMGAYSLMTLFSAVCVPLVYLQIRQQVIDVSGVDAAGHWEAMNRISSYYMLFVTTLVSVYFLPKLVLADGNREIRGIFLSYLSTVVPMFIASGLLLFWLRDLVISILFTADFKPVSDLFAWQILGDGFRCVSLIFGCCLIAKKMTQAFFVTEILSLVILYVASHLLLQAVGIRGLVIAHAVTYSAYALVLIGYFGKTLWSPDVS